MSTTALAIPVLADLTREGLRAEHQVRPLRPDEEGSAFSKLPGGVYGFTYAPATETPLFAAQAYHSFEVHKLPDGSGRLLVHCTREQKARLQSGGPAEEMLVYPDPWQDATELVAIALDRLMNSLYKPIRRDGNAVPLRVG
jgi:hypothetical protein